MSQFPKALSQEFFSKSVYAPFPVTCPFRILAPQGFQPSLHQSSPVRPSRSPNWPPISSFCWVFSHSPLVTSQPSHFKAFSRIVQATEYTWRHVGNNTEHVIVERNIFYWRLKQQTKELKYTHGFGCQQSVGLAAWKSSTANNDRSDTQVRESLNIPIN